MDGMKLKS